METDVQRLLKRIALLEAEVILLKTRAVRCPNCDNYFTPEEAHSNGGDNRTPCPNCGYDVPTSESKCIMCDCSMIDRDTDANKDTTV